MSFRSSSRSLAASDNTFSHNHQCSTDRFWIRFRLPILVRGRRDSVNRPCAKSQHRDQTNKPAIRGHLDSIATTQGSVAGTGARSGQGQRQAASRAAVRLWDHDPLAAGDGFSSSDDEDSSAPSWTPRGGVQERDQFSAEGGSSTGTSTPQRPPSGENRVLCYLVTLMGRKLRLWQT